MSLEQAVFYYREQWQPERGFQTLEDSLPLRYRFKRGRIPALPIYFQDENRIQGLMFLLTIALRVFTLFAARLGPTTAEEEEAWVEYLEFLRSRRKGKKNR